MFKRRKPEETIPATPGKLELTPLPAKPALTPLPSALQETKVEKPDPQPVQPAKPVVVSSGDSGLGVPPFRPAPPKEAQAMSRPPFPTPSTTPAAPTGPATVRPTAPTRAPSRDPAERRTLVVGRGISVQGTVQDAERLVVEGTVEATMIHATELSIAPGGVFKGEIEVEDAEIAGTIDGTLTARGSLVIRTSGKVLGTARCRRLQVEDGGQITGRVEMLTDQPHADSPPRLTVESVA